MRFTFVFIVLVTACVPKKKNDLSTVDLSDYQEEYRPQFHFSPDSMWMNDPNGMVYYDGEYHLFYQYYPDSTVWGPMHWGHAVSNDMVEWEHLPIALYPDEHGLIFSGSAVIDTATSGFGTEDVPAMVAIYTYHDMDGERSGAIDFQTQGLAYSLDKGRSWTKYENNPVILNPGIKDFRDPKVRWHEPTSKWIMALAVKDHISFYSSPNLKDWTFESDFGIGHGAHGGVWECPDLFPLTTKDGDSTKWVLLVSINPGAYNGGSGTQYFVGEFDGKEFTSSQHTTLWLDYGRDNYAGVTWSNIPDSDDRTLFVGWMSNWDYARDVPTERWRSAMTIPRVLELRKVDDTYKVASSPINELNSVISGKTASGQLNEPELFDSETYQLNLELSDLSEKLIIELSNKEGNKLEIVLDPDQQLVALNRDSSGVVDFSSSFIGLQYAPLPADNGLTRIQLFVDLSSVELFINDGELAMTNLIFPESPFNIITVSSSQNDLSVIEFDIRSIDSIW